jgi:hypothetical protein
MNFGQALAAVINNGRITCAELGQPGSYLGMEKPAGNLTEPFIALHRSNGIVRPWVPTQEAILATGWTMAGTMTDQRETHAGESRAEHAEHASSR